METFLKPLEKPLGVDGHAVSAPQVGKDVHHGLFLPGRQQFFACQLNELGLGGPCCKVAHLQKLDDVKTRSCLDYPGDLAGFERADSLHERG